jgi:dihydroflavonol-4-reductase
MKIGITGVTGHVGSNLYPILLKQGHEIKCLIHRPDRNRHFHEEISGDVTNESDVDSFVQGCDVVIHLAAKISISGDPDGSVRNVNFQGTKNIAEACLKHGIKRLVHFGTIHAYDPFPLDEDLDESRTLVQNGTAYDRSKVDGELAIMQCVQDGLDAVILTPTSIFGPNDYSPSLLGQAIIDIYNGKLPALVPGGYDFVDVRDVAMGTVRAMESGIAGEKYLLSGTWLSVKELAKKIGSIGGVSVPQRVIPTTLVHALLPFFKLQSAITRKPPLITRESLLALVESNKRISSDKAAHTFGYRRTEIDQSIKDTLDWFRDQSKFIR